MKTPQLVIMMFLAMLGIAMIIHSWGDFGAAAITSDVVGIVLVFAGIISFVLFFKRDNQIKNDAK